MESHRVRNTMVHCLTCNCKVTSLNFALRAWRNHMRSNSGKAAFHYLSDQELDRIGQGRPQCENDLALLLRSTKFLAAIWQVCEAFYAMTENQQC